MGDFYRLSELGLQLPAGQTVIPAARFAPVEAATLLLEEAEAKARQIVEEAQAAYAAEQVRGYEAGLEEARLAAAERLLDENRALEIGLQSIERELSRLVVSCVHRLIDGFDDRTRAEAIVRSALKQMRQEKRAELRVPPALFSHFRATITTITTEFPEIELVDVIEDPALTGSHIVLETDIGRVDGNLDSRLADLDVILHRAHAHAAEAEQHPAADPVQARHE